MCKSVWLQISCSLQPTPLTSVQPARNEGVSLPQCRVFPLGVCFHTAVESSHLKWHRRVLWFRVVKIGRSGANSSSLVFWLLFPLEQAWPPNFSPKLISATKEKDRQKSTALWVCGHCASPKDQKVFHHQSVLTFTGFPSVVLNTSSGFHFAMKSVLWAESVHESQTSTVALSPIYLAFTMCT